MEPFSACEGGAREGVLVGDDLERSKQPTTRRGEKGPGVSFKEEKKIT